MAEENDTAELHKLFVYEVEQKTRTQAECTRGGQQPGNVTLTARHWPAWVSVPSVK